MGWTSSSIPWCSPEPSPSTSDPSSQATTPTACGWVAVNRISRTGQPVGLEQRISPWEALRAVSCGAAYQYGEEDSKGQIREGMRADLVVLSADPLATAPQGMRDIEVLETIKDGNVVYRA